MIKVILDCLILILVCILLFSGIAVAFFTFAFALYDASKDEFNHTLDLARNCKVYKWAFNYFKKKYN